MSKRLGAQSLIEREDFPYLLTALHNYGYQVIGPTLRDGLSSTMSSTPRLIYS